ncbi:MAG: peptidase T [Bacteroidales bacterium]|jgi:tripeptide aminopeptidase|nr:peptidase T [Bacteroidales bacterium]MCI2121712.1 peptidase T [Bacteroidales bacterium]MCI2145794.1 peptidase T [Bacteroidales bacterium]
METVKDKFLRYISYDTQSNEDNENQPSTEKQLILLKLLAEELKGMGIADAAMDEYGYVMATIPSNLKKEVPAVGFIAHVDTAPDASGKDIKPQIISNYNGEDIVLNKGKGITLKTSDFPEMTAYKGETMITTDGTTLLGADDKAGVAEIMAVAEYLTSHPEVEHGPVKIAFTPDEEIGRGVVKFDVRKFGAKYAYTMDGGAVGELEFENFNAASTKIHIQGSNLHPGYAKGKMVNSIIIGCELNGMLPVEQRPEFTEKYEGFFHIIGFKGTVEETTIQYIIRDHDMQKFEAKKKMMQDVVDFLNRKYGEGTVTAEIKDQYYNMRKMIEPHYHIVAIAVQAMEAAGVKPIIQPIRGGTDGANLSFKGLPCPNLFAGGHNFHGKLEYVPVESMEKAEKVILNIIKIFAER